MKFCKRLNELISENNLKVEELQAYLNLKSPSLIYFWIDGTYTPKLSYLNKLANFFKCPIDYLVGTIDDYDEIKKDINLPQFDERLQKILIDKNLSKKFLTKQNIISSSLYRSIFERKSDPTIETLIKLADYLNVSVDYLVGRE